MAYPDPKITPPINSLGGPLHRMPNKPHLSPNDRGGPLGMTAQQKADAYRMAQFHHMKLGAILRQLKQP